LPPQQSPSVYPIPIPPEKQERALELYNKYILANLAEHIDSSPAATTYTTLQKPSQDGGGPSTKDSVIDDSSVVSFEFSANSNEFVSGKKPKVRTRKALSPPARAKAAIIRYLGSCTSCRNRRVKVSIILHCYLTKHRSDRY